MQPIDSNERLGISVVDDDGDEAALLRHVDASKPPALRRDWEGKGRKRKPVIVGLTQVGGATVLHLPWFRAPQPPPSRTLWLVLASGVAVTIAVAALSAAWVFDSELNANIPRMLIYSAIASVVAFGAVMASYHQRRAKMARRDMPTVVRDVHGIIATQDALLVRFPGTTFRIPRSRIAGIRVVSSGDATGNMSAIAEFAFALVLRDDTGAEHPVVLDEVVESAGTADTAGKTRLATLYVAADWLTKSWLAGGKDGLGYRANSEA